MAGFPNAPTAGAFPVLLPKKDGVDVPEPGLDPVVPPPKRVGPEELAVPEGLRLEKRLLDGGCDVAGVDWPKGDEVPEPEPKRGFCWLVFSEDPFEAPFPVPFCPPLPPPAPKLNGFDISQGRGGR